MCWATNSEPESASPPPSGEQNLPMLRLALEIGDGTRLLVKPIADFNKALKAQNMDPADAVRITEMFVRELMRSH